MAISKLELAGELVLLLPQKAIFLIDKQCLIISDLHLGKINHFRKAGIAAPVAANNANTETLIKLMMDLKPKRVIFIGDLFHSHYNAEWEVLGQVIKNFNLCSFELVPGNHDIMSQSQYQKHKIKVLEPQYSLTPRITLVHEPVIDRKVSQYYISGHIHPAIMLTGKGKQSLTFPCFWFGEQQGFLPAFGVFTGFKRIKPMATDKVFAIVNDQVMSIPSAAG